MESGYQEKHLNFVSNNNGSTVEDIVLAGSLPLPAVWGFGRKVPSKANGSVVLYCLVMSGKSRDICFGHFVYIF